MTKLEEEKKDKELNCLPITKLMDGESNYGSQIKV